MLGSDLRRRLEAVGVDPDDIGDPGSVWDLLHESYGRRATLIDRYELEAEQLGVAPQDLHPDTRRRLAVEVLRAHDPEWTVTPGSERRQQDPVEVVDYDPSWVTRFDEWHALLTQSLGEVARRIEHIGSTAVPGLDAKPVVDIQVSVIDPDSEDFYVAAIEGLGVALRAREGDGHRYFRPSGVSKRVVQIHVCRTDSEWERTHLLFRDFLRSDKRARGEYARLKRSLAASYRDDRFAYNQGKTGFILDALKQAEIWAKASGWDLPKESTDGVECV